MKPLSNGERLLNRQPFIVQRALSSVRFGGIFYPANSIGRQMSKAAEMLFLMNPGERNDVSLRGTATLLKYKDRYWAITTRHQVADSDIEYVGLMADFPNHFTTSERCVWLGAHKQLLERDEYDLYAFEFSAPVRSGVISAARFLSLLEIGYLFDGDEVSFASTYGFRFDDQRIEWSDCEKLGSRMDHLHVVKREMVCDYHGDSMDHSTAVVRPLDPGILAMNGMSGAPVFITTFSDMQHVCKFAGIVVRGGNGHLHFLKHTIIRRLMERATRAE